jgi:hypothetical protein
MVNEPKAKNKKALNGMVPASRVIVGHPPKRKKGSGCG